MRGNACKERHYESERAHQFDVKFFWIYLVVITTTLPSGTTRSSHSGEGAVIWIVEMSAYTEVEDDEVEEDRYEGSRM